MVEHLRALGIVSLIRALIEGAIGSYLLQFAAVWSTGPGRFLRLQGVPEPGDREVFFAIGTVIVLFAALRFVQSIACLWSVRWSRRFGILLAVFDFALPFTLPFGLWGIAIYRHPETIDHFVRHQRRSRRSGDREAARGAVA